MGDLREQAGSRKRVLARYIDTSVKVGLALLVLAVAALVAAAFAGGTLGAIFGTVGGAVFTVAVLNFLFDPFQKDALAREILDRLGVRDAITHADLVDIGSRDSLEWSLLLGQSTSISVMPLDPFRWFQEEFRYVLAHASSHATVITIYVPAPGTPFIGTIADRLRTPEAELDKQLSQLPDGLASAWDASTLDPNAKLGVYQYRGAPATGILLCDAGAVIEVGPGIRNAPMHVQASSAIATQILVFGPRSPYTEWVRRQLKFEGDEIPPTAAAVRPLGTTQRRGGRPHHATGPPAADGDVIVRPESGPDA